MGGELWVTSVYGSGSQFYFTLKFKSHTKAQLDTFEKIKRFKGRNILFLDGTGDQMDIESKLTKLGLNAFRITGISESVNMTDATVFQQSNDNKQPPIFDTVIVDNMAYAEKIREAVHLRYTPIILIAPEIHRLNMKLCIDLGITGYLNSPVSLSDLAYTLLPALESHSSLPADSAIPQPLKILLAEDNIVNQKLAVRILEKFGHKVEIVSNGKLAVEAFERNTYDLILMDVQMPIMGGFEATQKIRDIEHKSATGSHVPIIALTAHAMIGDREKCLQSGMDEYVTKPLRFPELIAAIKKFAPQSAHAMMAKEPAKKF
jgi:osomolarity two-component system sensor histidine kinase NIK1